MGEDKSVVGLRHTELLVNVELSKLVQLNTTICNCVEPIMQAQTNKHFVDKKRLKGFMVNRLKLLHSLSVCTLLSICEIPYVF